MRDIRGTGPVPGDLRKCLTTFTVSTADTVLIFATTHFPRNHPHRCHFRVIKPALPGSCCRPSHHGMLVDGQKWACEACIRGHRVSSCKHHGILPSLHPTPIQADLQDRPLIRIKRKGRPFATCTICHSTPCEAPTEHTRLKRESELKAPPPSAKVTPSHHTHHRQAGRQISTFGPQENQKTCRRPGADICFVSCSLEIFPGQTLSSAPSSARVPPYRTAAVG